MFFMMGIVFTTILTIGSLYFNLYKYDQLRQQAYSYEYLPYQEEDDEFYWLNNNINSNKYGILAH